MTHELSELLAQINRLSQENERLAERINRLLDVLGEIARYQPDLPGYLAVDRCMKLASRALEEQCDF